MSKKIKIKNQDYYSRDDIQIEISEEIVTPVEVRKTVVSVANIKKTIQFLKDKKEEINAEIKMNQDLLDQFKTEIDNVVIKDKPTPLGI